MELFTTSVSKVMAPGKNAIFDAGRTAAMLIAPTVVERRVATGQTRMCARVAVRLVRYHSF
jgi:hypothetical protein